MVQLGRIQPGVPVVQEKRTRIAIQKPKRPVLQVLQRHRLIVIHLYGRYSTAIDAHVSQCQLTCSMLHTGSG